MKKLIPAVLALVMLSGCGAHGVVGATNATAATVAAQSKAAAEKAIHAMFRASFKAADKNGDKKLTIDEMPGVLPAPALNANAVIVSEDAKQMFKKLDANKDGHIGYREFASKENEASAIKGFRAAVSKIFTTLDKNGDHLLTEAELKDSEYAMAKNDLNKNGKITVSEFENAFAAAQSAGPDPVEPPAPVIDPNAPPAPVPAVDPNAPPAPVPAVDPIAPPAPVATKTK